VLYHNTNFVILTFDFNKCFKKSFWQFTDQIKMYFRKPPAAPFPGGRNEPVPQFSGIKVGDEDENN
jgi:hypothetical protein